MARWPANTAAGVKGDLCCLGAVGIGGRAGELLGSLAGQVLKSAVRQAANPIGRHLVLGLPGSLLGGKRR